MSFDDWRQAHILAEYDLPLQAEPKQQGHGRKLKTKAFQDTVAAIIEDACQQKAARDARIGLRVIFVGRFAGDLSNCIKALEDGMNRRAFHDDRQIDYIEAVRIPGPEPAIIAQVIEK